MEVVSVNSSNRQVVYLKNKTIPRDVSLRESRIIYSGNFHFERSFERFDFLDEWNNLGYGRITTDATSFSISDYSLSEDEFDKVLATFQLSDGTTGVFSGVKGESLVFNREMGPVDGVDAFLVDDFLSAEIPVLIDIPFGFKSSVTMRIDCDEAIGTGRILADLYKEYSVPFSMAITTHNEFDPVSVKLMRDVIDAGGSICSHSQTHAPNWGGSREKAKWEAETARNRLREVLSGDYNYDFVVSPFHQTPKYAVEGLRDAGIKGFVAGIIKNDPEYLVSRASWAKDVPGIMTHSQQCMLHGDCYHASGLSVYKESFDNHYKTNTFFGYLDHPFSNYKYGWDSEAERLKVHGEFLKFLKSYKDVWFANLVDAMSFLWVKVNCKVWVENDELKWKLPEHNYANLPDLCVLWKGERYRIPLYS